MIFLLVAFIIAFAVGSLVEDLLRFFVSPAGGATALFLGLWATAGIGVALAATAATVIPACVFRPVAWLGAAIWGLCLGFVPFAVLTILGVPVLVSLLAMPLTAITLASASSGETSV